MFDKTFGGNVPELAQLSVVELGICSLPKIGRIVLYPAPEEKFKSIPPSGL